jgi:fumarate hydratase, class II
MNIRIEKDSLGMVEIPADKYWGAQTQRCLKNFRIGEEKMPYRLIQAYAIVKKAAANTNAELNILPVKKAQLIEKVCDEIIEGSLKEHFPLPVWQSGSGTQTNMNVNEVIANRAHVLQGNTLGEGERFLHPNDDVNKSQSTNDTFPTAMHVAVYKLLYDDTLNTLTKLNNTLKRKAESFKEVVKTGRTHWMDAVPITLGQEFSGYAAQLDMGIKALENTLAHLSELAIGGTAVGTGLNTPKGFTQKVVEKITKYSGYPFSPAKNPFAALAAHDAIIEVSGALKQIATALIKIAGDVRIMASGPRCGLAEVTIPANEPGSSIMPGKINPTQIEALIMVCTKIIGNDTTIAFASTQGRFELNVAKPLLAHTIINSASLLAEACASFNYNCLNRLEPNRHRLEKYTEVSLMLITALNTHIGYEKAAEIAQKAYNENTTLREAAVNSGYVSEQDFDQWVNPDGMV